jgi:hypothetical protein
MSAEPIDAKQHHAVVDQLNPRDIASTYNRLYHPRDINIQILPRRSQCFGAISCYLVLLNVINNLPQF